MRTKCLLITCIYFLFVHIYSSAQEANLYQAAYNGEFYEYGYNSLPIIPITGAPEDTDYERWSILHDGSVYRLYFMPLGKADKLYQFGFNPNSQSYEYGYKSNEIIPIINLPENTDASSFAILYDGLNYRLYFKSSLNKTLYQCAYNPQTGPNGSYIYGYKSEPEIAIKNAPPDTDWKTWSMLFDGETYRLYFKSKTKKSTLYQFGYDGLNYTFGYQSNPRIEVIGMPKKEFVKNFNITHDGTNYRLYNLKISNY
jgi:hypothetical protein